MGCWNTRGAPRNAVLDAVRDNAITNLVLAGDNVYPLKKDEPHQIAVFEEGIAGLGGKTIITSAFGNHNVKNAPMMAHQRAFFGRPAGTPLYFCIEFNDVSLIVLDTNIMEDDAQRAEMAAFLTAQLAALPAGKPYYIVQHEPFASYKKTKDPILPHGDEILTILATKPPIAILCADTHNYQEGILNVGGVAIRQIIVGTGGAAFDVYRNDQPPLVISTATPIVYTLDAATSLPHYRQYGYYQMDAPGVGHFIEVTPWEGAGGGQRRTHKRTHKRTRKQKRRVSRRRV
jgi:hypothetical protein